MGIDKQGQGRAGREGKGKQAQAERARRMAARQRAGHGYMGATGVWASVTGNLSTHFENLKSPILARFLSHN